MLTECCSGGMERNFSLLFYHLIVGLTDCQWLNSGKAEIFHLQVWKTWSKGNEKVLILSKSDLFQAGIHEITEFTSSLCYKKRLRTGNGEGLNKKMGKICFINLPNWIQVKDNTERLSTGSLFYSHELFTSTIIPSSAL